MSVSPPLTCQVFVEKASDYLEGALRWADRVRLEAHLALCAGCRAYLAQLRQILRWLREVGRRRPAPAARVAGLNAFRAWHSHPS